MGVQFPPIAFLYFCCTLVKASLNLNLTQKHVSWQTFKVIFSTAKTIEATFNDRTCFHTDNCKVYVIFL